MYETLLSRRSVRKYAAKQITDAELDKVLEAGLYAPTAKNNQKPVMVAVRDKETRDLLSEINAEIMIDMLEMESIETDHAANGSIAVDMFRDSDPGTYSAILMDVRMPVMDGLEAAAKIRTMKREDAKRIPIIALTANAFDEDVQRSMQAGMNAHLSKPVD
ncbi:response regulator, partial [Vibrio sp. FNV 38]|nr:response regulator [Vibrio sp. FNV 38]